MLKPKPPLSIFQKRYNKSEERFVSRQRVSGLPEKGLTCGEVWGTCQEVWETSGESLDCSSNPQ